MPKRTIRPRVLIVLLAAVTILWLRQTHEQAIILVAESTGANTTVQLKTRPKNVIAYSMYGAGKQYWGGAMPNAKLAQQIFPGWEVRFYHDSSVPKAALDELNNTMPNVKLYDMTDTWIANPRAWRFLVALDPEITGAYILRDTDSRLTHRERSAVEEWIRSNYTFHFMHDHPHHCFYKLQAGMFGGKGLIPEMECVLKRCAFEDTAVGKYDDQQLLEKFVWPAKIGHAMHHDSFCCGIFNENIPSRPFPTARDAATRDHVGSQYTPDGRPMTTAPLHDKCFRGR